MTARIANGREQEKMSVSIVLSLAAHTLLALFLAILVRSSAPTKIVDLSEIIIDVVEVNKTSRKNDNSKKQIVETEIAKESVDTTKDAYLSEKSQKILQQTRAAQVAAFQRAHISAGSPQATNKAEPIIDASKSLAELGVKANLRPLGHLSPTLREAAIEASSNDYLKDVKPGAQTLLSTKEYAYFSFYQRIRRQLEQYWEPGLRRRLRSMISRGRTLASESEHATKLVVVLNSIGTVTGIKVDDTSGVVDLDQAAVDAFNKAGPFPNPPKGMFESDGTVHVEWEFILKT